MENSKKEKEKMVERLKEENLYKDDFEEEGTRVEERISTLNCSKVLDGISKSKSLLNETEQIQTVYKFIVYPGNNQTLLRNALRKRANFIEVSHKDDCNFDFIDFIWKPTSFLSHNYSKIEKANLYRENSKSIVANHIENIKGISTKTGLIRSLKRYYKTNPLAVEQHYSIFESTPTTFLVLSDCQDNEYHSFIRRFKELATGSSTKEKLPHKHCAQNVWLVKPAALNQGKGIEIFKNLREIKQFIYHKPLHTYWVVQKYLEKPLLFKQRKFDIRVWAMITSKGELFFYEKGYLRTSSCEFTVDHKSLETFVHLTNNCLQKHGAQYGIHEEGNTLSFEQFKIYLNETYPTINFDLNGIILRIKDLIIDSYLSIRKELNPNKRRNCFELLGFDFLIDEDFRTWLIEVNSNPYLGIPNAYIGELLPKLIDDILEIVLDPICPPLTKVVSREKNHFDLLYHMEKGKVKVNKRRNFNEGIYPIEELKPSPLSPVEIRLGKKRIKKSLNIMQQQNQNGLEDSPFRAYSEKSQPKPHSLPKKDKSAKRLSGQRIEKMLEKVKERESEPEEENLNHSSLMKMEDFINTSKFTHKKNKINYPPRKNLFDQTQELMTKFSERDFQTVTQKISSRFINCELFPEKDIEDAIKSLKLLINSKIITHLAMSQTFFDMIKLALDFKKELPLSIREVLLEMLETASKEFTTKASLLDPQILAPIIDLILESCGKQCDEKQAMYFTYCMRILTNIPAFEKPPVYIPGETKEWEKIRQKLIRNGGIICIYYAQNESLQEEIQNLAKDTIKFMLENYFKDFSYQIFALQTFLKEDGDEQLDKCEINDRNLCQTTALTDVAPVSPRVSVRSKTTSHHSLLRKDILPKQLGLKFKNRSFSIPKREDQSTPVKFPSKVNSIEMDEVKEIKYSNKLQNIIDLEGVLENMKNDYETKMAELQKNSEEAKLLKSHIQEIEIKRKEVERKSYEDRKEKAVQELFNRYDQKKKKKMIMLKKELADREQKIKEQEEKRKSLQEFLLKKEGERKAKQIEILKRKAEEEKKKLEELELRKKEQFEMQKKILYEWNQKKLEGLKRKKIIIKKRFEDENIGEYTVIGGGAGIRERERRMISELQNLPPQTHTHTHTHAHAHAHTQAHNKQPRHTDHHNLSTDNTRSSHFNQTLTDTHKSPHFQKLNKINQLTQLNQNQFKNTHPYSPQTSAYSDKKYSFPASSSARDNLCSDDAGCSRNQNENEFPRIFKDKKEKEGNELSGSNRLLMSLKHENKKTLLNTISHENLKSHEFKKILPKCKKLKKDMITEMDYKIYSIYSTTLSKLKRKGKKKIPPLNELSEENY